VLAVDSVLVLWVMLGGQLEPALRALTVEVLNLFKQVCHVRMNAYLDSDAAIFVLSPFDYFVFFGERNRVLFPKKLLELWSEEAIFAGGL